MSTSLHDVSADTYSQILQGISGVLAKGAEYCSENGINPDDLLGRKLADDMFDFRMQVIAVAHHSKGALEGIQNSAFAPPDFGAANDYAGLQALIEDALTSVQSQSADAVNGTAGGKVIFSLGDNQIPFTTENFILSFSLPNFYFHASTTYDILRAEGVKVGKRDFLGPMRVGI